MEKRNPLNLKKRLVIIFIFTLIAGSGIYVFFFSWNESFQLTKAMEKPLGKVGISSPPNVVPQSNSMNWDNVRKVREQPGQIRTLKEYYSRRAFLGAPPYVPHPIEQDTDCLACHKNGGFSAKRNRFTPMTPHPERVGCAQCHIDRQLLGGVSFAGAFVPPKLKDKSKEFFPATIPHEIDTRKNCYACHGPGAPAEIRSPHPERPNCTQCHVEQTPKFEE